MPPLPMVVPSARPSLPRQAPLGSWLAASPLNGRGLPRIEAAALRRKCRRKPPSMQNLRRPHPWMNRRPCCDVLFLGARVLRVAPRRLLLLLQLPRLCLRFMVAPLLQAGLGRFLLRSPRLLFLLEGFEKTWTSERRLLRLLNSSPRRPERPGPASARSCWTRSTPGACRPEGRLLPTSQRSLGALMFG